MKKPGTASDPLWFKDAVIYELHVRAFFDSNGDGVGDLPGLTQKVDYLQDLGVTCVWLLPFFPSPLRDDGYDISDYTNVHPMYGTIDDFRVFLETAHDRGLQVMIELVMNHTSDQHPWFQAARNAPPGSPERDFYVWSETDQVYRDARIIFTDTEKSNWTWDPVAQAYYWHRFFSHQPDLNFDNPRVVEEMLKIMRFWLDLGVDALRLDAIPYLVERDGTNCENLPETHVLIKALRREIDEQYSSRMILAEANQWPADVRPYFGDGDECHMAFHFPLMPRIYMALRQEDRLPITDIMSQTPAIPETCQWGLFLRNHDELTLEMVTNDERDYMYLAYSADTRMRINLGIRRRLAPLVDNNRRRIELLNSLLFSFPGTPILYYGDEIGMGDNIYLGDRNGVRTPMQWNSDRNAGFSRANPARLYSPVIMDPVWGYEAINVEAQQSDPSSLLSWMRNMIALRKLFRVFGRGTLQFLNPSNRKVLAYLRRNGDEQILCVANLSRFAQPVDLDLAELEGMTPVEMLGYVQFPRIEKQAYRLTLGPYGFLWLELHGKSEPADVASEEDLLSLFADTWETVLEGQGRSQLEAVLLSKYLGKQPWFEGTVLSTRVVDWGELAPSTSIVALIEVRYHSGEPEFYLIPLGMTYEPESDRIRQESPNAVLSSVVSRGKGGVMHDGALDDAACAALFALIETGGRLATRHGELSGGPGAMLASLRGSPDAPMAAVRRSAEQRAIVYDEKFFLRLFPRLEPLPHPECEIGKYLTETAHFGGVPPYAGCIDYDRTGNGASTFAVLQGLVAHEGDGWTLTVEELDRYYENSAGLPLPEELKSTDSDAGIVDLITLSGWQPCKLAEDHLGIALDAAARIGKSIGELHLALGAPTDAPAFSPETLTATDLQKRFARFRQDSTVVFDVLRANVAQLPDEVLDQAGMVLAQRKQILGSFQLADDDSPYGQRIRIHGDLHLGQVLRVRTQYVVVNFREREKHSPLRDVACMLRSLARAAYSSLISYTARRPEDFEKLEPWARLWERSASAEFLRAYRGTVKDAPFLPAGESGFRTLLRAYWLDSVLHELSQELHDRPAWARIPLMGILSLPIEAGGLEWNSTPFRSRL